MRVVADDCNLLYGHVQADAAASGTYGGSGGSVWLQCGILRGAGDITADGGGSAGASTSPRGGGSGGRIAVYVQA